MDSVLIALTKLLHRMLYANSFLKNNEVSLYYL
jgi:hypothetical protein